MLPPSSYSSSDFLILFTVVITEYEYVVDYSYTTVIIVATIVPLLATEYS
jgi:hypothetical protein